MYMPKMVALIINLDIQRQDKWWYFQGHEASPIDRDPVVLVDHPTGKKT